MVEAVLISLALISGVMAFFGPCGIAMLPAYVSYVLGQKKPKNGSKFISKCFFFGLVASLGIISVYLVMGIAFSSTGTLLKPFIPLLGFAVGVILIAIGVLVYFEKFPYVNFYHPKSTGDLKGKRSFISFYIFGAGYGVAQLSCTLPIFLLVVFQALAVGSLIGGLIIFLIYGVGISLGIIIVTIGSTVSREVVQKYIAIIVPHIRKLTALVLIAAGLYQIYFQVIINNLFAQFPV